MPTSQTFPLSGGLDLKTPVHKMPPGRLIQALNVEQKIAGGYGRLLGYEKFDTTEVPGEGSILGVWVYAGKVYAFRKALGVSTATMYESTGSGWTSKKTGLALGNTYEFVNYNFAGTQKMYGVNGAHKAFEWDGTTWTDITTGMSTDTPEHIIAHRKYLFLTFSHSVQYSPVGDPTGTWTPLTGAGEISVEEGVTGLMQLSGGSLAIFGRHSTNILSGSGPSDWVNSSMTEHGNRIGCIPRSIQQLGSRLTYFDDRGLINLYTSDKFGDFADATISYLVNDILLPLKDNVTTSCVVKDKSQYRIFFQDGTGLIVTYAGDQMVGITRLKFPDPVETVCSLEDSMGDEVIYFGSDTGYVYQMESGDSFDGADIEAFFRLAYTDLGSPRVRKRFHRANFGLEAQSTVTLQVKPDFQFESTGTIPPIDFTPVTFSTPGSLLGTGLLGSFILGASYITEGQADLPGHGVYVSTFFYSVGTQPPWEVESVSYDYTPRRRRR